MHSIDKEKNFLWEIARKDFTENKVKDYLMDSMDETGSYYIDRDTSQSPSALTEYEFQTPMELRELLEKQFTDSSERNMIPAIMVAAFKLRSGASKTENISEKIYNF